jgi:RNA polymerase sigma factor (TIGR02999 family)
MPSLTELLHAASAGDAQASDRLFERVYAEMKRMAHSRLHRGGGRSDELDTTALVHESYLNLSRRGELLPTDRAAFFCYVGRVMRNVVVDHVRERLAQKRGGNEVFVTLTTGVEGDSFEDERLLAVNSALDVLERVAPEFHQLVEMRYFAGLSVREVAELRGTSPRTVQREWEKARAYLHQLIGEA